MADQEMIEAFENYLKDTRGLQPKTRKDYQRYYKTIDPEQKIDQVFVNAFLQLHGNNSNVRGFILNLLKFMGKDHEIGMPEKSLKDKKKKVINPISPEEIELLKKYLYKKGFKYGFAFDLIYQGALRRSEITTIKINSFRWNNFFINDKDFCELKIHGKGDKERIVKIRRATMERFVNYYTEKTKLNDLNSLSKIENLLFKNMSDHKLYWIIKRSSKKILGRDIRPHQLRHHRATELMDRGANIMNIKNYLGHSSVKVTEGYLHKEEKKSLEEIEEFL
jgi:integrase